MEDAFGLARCNAAEYARHARAMIAAIDVEREREYQFRLQDWMVRNTRYYWWEFWLRKKPTEADALRACSKSVFHPIWGARTIHWKYYENCERVLRLCGATSDGHVYLSPDMISSLFGDRRSVARAESAA